MPNQPHGSPVGRFPLAPGVTPVVSVVPVVALLVLATLGLALGTSLTTPLHAQTPVPSVAADGVAPSSADNDFTRLDLAIRTASPGDVLLLEGTFDWTEANARTSWSRGSDGTAGTADDYRVTVPAGLDGVTLTAVALGQATVQGPGDLPFRDQEAFLFFPGPNRSWVISNLEVLDIDVAFDFFSSATADFTGTQFVHNRLRIPADLDDFFEPAERLRNIGIRLAVGRDQTLEGNVFEIPGDGIGAPLGNVPHAASMIVEIQPVISDPTAYDGLLLEGNSFQVLGPQSDTRPELIRGVFDQSSAHGSSVTYRANTFENLHSENDPTANKQSAFVVRAQSTATSTVLYEDNRVQGVEVAFQWALGGDLSPFEPVFFTRNDIQGVERSFVLGSGGRAVLRCNRIFDNRLHAMDILQDNGSVSAEHNWWGCNTGPDTPGCDVLAFSGASQIATSPWLVLSGQPTRVGAGETAPLPAGFTVDSEGQPVDKCSVPDGIEVAFAVEEGTVSPVSAPTVDGVATVTYTADKGGRQRTVGFTASADNATALGSIEVVPPGQSEK